MIEQFDWIQEAERNAAGLFAIPAMISPEFNHSDGAPMIEAIAPIFCIKTPYHNPITMQGLIEKFVQANQNRHLQYE